MNQPLTQTQKKTEPAQPDSLVAPVPADTLNPEIIAAVSAMIEARRKESLWLVPLIVFMIVAATIYLAILNNKVEYVYSLATACIGYYFGQQAQIPSPPNKNSLERP